MMEQRSAGTFRLITLGLAAALALTAGSAHAQGGGAATGRVAARVTATTRDTANAKQLLIVRAMSARIDSLVQKLNGLPVGSPEALAVQNALEQAMREFRPTGVSGQVYIQMARPTIAFRSTTDLVPKGWVGFTAAGYNETWFEPAGNYLQYFEYPTIVAIEANSPASRAGVRAGDSLIAYNGLDVKAQPFNMTRLLTPGREIAVRVRRGGEAKEVQLVVETASPTLMAERRASVAELLGRTHVDLERREIETRAAVAVARNAPATVSGRSTVIVGAPAAPSMRPMTVGVLGAGTADVDEGLASNLVGMKGKTGVLVTSVPPGSLAERTGLQKGDVILRVESTDIASTPQLAARLYVEGQSGSGKINLTVLRGGKTQQILYTPPR